MTTLRSNVVALLLLQVANFALPLVTLPYLTRVLGLENFGMMVLVQAVMQYFSLLTGWGFSLSVTRKVSALRADNNAVDEIFSAAWAAQWLLMGCAGILLVILVCFLPAVNQHTSLYAWGFAAVFGSVLFPVWLFQGLEKMKAVAFVQVLGRVIILPAYFFLVQGPEDAVVAVALNGSAAVLTGLFSIYWIRRHQIVRWRWPSFQGVWSELREGALVFSSNIAISLYTRLTPIALSTISGPSAVGVFDLANKICSAGTAILSPLSQALFPRMSYLFENDRPHAVNLLRKSGLILVISAAIGGVVMFFCADLIVTIFGGAAFKESATLLRCLSPLPLIIVGSNICGVQVMLPLKRSRAFSYIYAGVGVLSLLLMIPLIIWNGAVGAALSTLITELSVTGAMIIYLRKIKVFGGAKNSAHGL